MTLGEEGKVVRKLRGRQGLGCKKKMFVCEKETEGMK